MARKAVLEDASHQAGWMFADLLLALMVIFLAAQSFVPKEASLPQFASLLSNKTSLVGTTPQLKTSITLKSLDEAALINALQAYGTAHNLPAAFTIESLVIAGGFNPKTESSDRGTATALQYAAGIESFNLPYFTNNTATLLAASSEVPDGEAILDVQITPIAPNHTATGSSTSGTSSGTASGAASGGTTTATPTPTPSK